MMKKILLLSGALAVLSCTVSDPLTLLVGTSSDAFYAYSFDQRSGEVIPDGEACPEAPGAFAKAPVMHPTFLAVEGDCIYAVSEMPDSVASITAWRLVGKELDDLESSQLTGLPERGGAPCHVATDGRFLAVSNYSGGSLSLYRLLPDGRIGPLDSLVLSGTGGPDPRRQQVPHVHCAIFSPDCNYLYFSEFSADEIGSLEVRNTGISHYKTAATLDPDTGPRHLLFDASGRHFYVIGELSGAITVFDYEYGKFERKQVIPADLAGGRGAADIHLSPDGRFLYASLRLKDEGVAIFEVAEDGTLTYIDRQPTGKHPRNFNLTPDGKFVLVACRDDNSIEIYSRDRNTGLLKDTGKRIAVPKPVFVGWM